jgi:hypothetical protein
VRVDGLGDAGEDCIGLSQDVIGPEPEHAVSPLDSLRGVLPAVDLDDQVSIGTTEVDDEGPDRMLSAELRADEVSVA